jgi:hypothetical protein
MTSQTTNKAVSINTLAPSFATWILSQCGDKQAQATIRIETVRAALIVALKGNKTQWMDAFKAVADKKTGTAKAFKSAFMALGEVSALFKPQDSISAKDKADAISAKADELVLVFDAAYQAEIPAEKTDAQKAAAKAEKEATKAKEIADAVSATIKEKGLVPADALASDAQVLALALTLIQSGKIGTTFADEFRHALGFESAKSAAFAEGKAHALAELTDKASGKTSRKTATQAQAIHA